MPHCHKSQNTSLRVGSIIIPLQLRKLRLREGQYYVYGCITSTVADDGFEPHGSSFTTILSLVVHLRKNTFLHFTCRMSNRKQQCRSLASKVAGFNLWVVRTCIPKAQFLPSCICAAHLLLLRIYQSSQPRALLRSKLPISSVLFLVSVTPGRIEFEFVVKTLNLNMPCEPYTEKLQVCLVNDAPITLFTFKCFINFSSKMTKWPYVHRLN